MKKVWYYFIKTFLWIFIANSLIALGFVGYNHRSLYLPEYGQGYWWAWRAAFSEAPENILFIIIAITALILLVTKYNKFTSEHTGVYKK